MSDRLEQIRALEELLILWRRRAQRSNVPGMARDTVGPSVVTAMKRLETYRYLRQYFPWWRALMLAVRADIWDVEHFECAEEFQARGEQ